VAIKYWLIFGAIAIIIICGTLANAVAPGPTINGMRYYFRAVIVFFLPAVMQCTDKQLRRYMLLVLGLSLLQIPIAISQRLHTASLGRFTGDYTTGTVLHSGVLSLLLICVICVLSALMLRGYIRKIWFGLLFLALVIPMSINETKVTVILLPLAMITTFILAAPRGRRGKVAIAATGMLVAAGMIFVPLYDYYNTLHNPYPFTIEDFFSDPTTVAKYADVDAEIGTNKEAGRVDSLTIPLQDMAHDPVKLILGLGIGNASNSSLGSQFIGAYQPRYGRYSLETSMACFLLETGVLGLALILLLHWILLKDALAVAREDGGLVGAVATGFVGTWIVNLLGAFYISTHTFDALPYLFWFFAGVIATRRTALIRQCQPFADRIESGVMGIRPQ